MNPNEKTNQTNEKEFHDCKICDYAKHIVQENTDEVHGALYERIVNININTTQMLLGCPVKNATDSDLISYFKNAIKEHLNGTSLIAQWWTSSRLKYGEVIKGELSYDSVEKVYYMCKHKETNAPYNRLTHDCKNCVNDKVIVKPTSEMPEEFILEFARIAGALNGAEAILTVSPLKSDDAREKDIFYAELLSKINDLRTLVIQWWTKALDYVPEDVKGRNDGILDYLHFDNIECEFYYCQNRETKEYSSEFECRYMIDETPNTEELTDVVGCSSCHK